MKPIISFLVLCLLVLIQTINAESPDVHNSIQGRWSGIAKDGTKINYSFKKDGQVTWQVGEKNFKKTFPNGLTGKYKITTAKPYSEIDISEFKHPVFKDFKYLGIVEVIDKGKFRMEGFPSRPGKQAKRPNKFTKAAIIFKKN